MADPGGGGALMTNLKIVLTVIGTLGLYTLVANSIPQVRSEVPAELSFGADVAPEELVTAGEELYAGAGGCTACHGLGTRAPNLLTGEGGLGAIGARGADRVQGQDCKAYLHESMVAPMDYVVEGYQPIMPDARRTLSENQIWALVAYLQSQGGDVTVTGQDLQDPGEEEAAGGGAAAAPAGGGGAQGAPGGLDPVALLQNNLCMNCHTMDGEGVALGPSFDDVGSRLDAGEIRAAILDPNAEASEGFEELLGTMPTNFGQMFTAAQLEVLVEYLAGRTGG